MVFNARFNNISVMSWRSVLLVGEVGVPGENYQPIPQVHNIMLHRVHLTMGGHACIVAVSVSWSDQIKFLLYIDLRILITRLVSSNFS
jgi:hypothetical protein